MSGTPAPVPPAAVPERMDALGRMLANATSWDTVPARVSLLVTVTSWALLAVTVGDLVVTRGLQDDGPFGVVLTGLGHSGLMVGALGVSAVLQMATAIATRGYRWADRAALRCWSAVLAVAAVVLAPAVLALVGVVLAIVLMVALTSLILVAVFAMLA